MKELHDAAIAGADTQPYMRTPTAGMWEFRRNNMFAATAFSSYGGFWLGYGIYGVLASGGTCSVPALNLSECSWRSSGAGDLCLDKAGWARPLWWPLSEVCSAAA